MGNKHLAEVLIEANKKISDIITKLEDINSANNDKKVWIDDLNSIIRSLDHIVEDLEK